MKKLLSSLLIIITVIPMLTVFSFAEEEPFPDLSHSKCAYLYNLSANTVLYEKNTTEKITPGPTVKLMTAAVAIDLLGNDLDRVVTVRKDLVDGVFGNNINLMDGEQLTVFQLLNALIIGNANDAAVVLASEAAGSLGAFVLKMNERATEIGATNTFYSNPTGLEEGEMCTTTEDIAKLAVYLSKYNIFKEISQKPYFIIGKTNKSNQRKIFNKNFFINTESEKRYYSPLVTGMTAGSTSQAGYCVVASSTYHNSDFICIIMGSEKDDSNIYSFRDCQNLLSWAYKNFSYQTVLSSSQVICTLPIKLSSETNSLAIMPKDSIDLFLNKNIDLDKEITLNWNLDVNELYAPVSNGTVVGKVIVLRNGQIMGSSPLVTKADIPQSTSLYLKYRIESFVSSSAFKWTVSILLIVLLGCLVSLLIKRRKKIIENKRKKVNESRRKYY